MSERPASGETVSFQADIKQLFRAKDRDSMRSAFDLWSYDDVSAYADSIAARVRDGSMPCDGAWPPLRVDLFQRWIDSGKPR